MYLERSRERHKKRMNRNFLIITVGFAVVAIFVAYALQHIMIRSVASKDLHILHCVVDNQSTQSLPCKIKIGDVIVFEDTIATGKIDFEKKWHFSVPQTITMDCNGKVDEIHNVVLQDSISYLMIQVTDTANFKMQFFN